MITEITYIGDGVQTDFNIPFEYAGADVQVDVDDVTVTATIAGVSTVRVSPAPANGAAVRVYRNTNIEERAVDFSDGAVLTEDDLDKSATQAFWKLQELVSDIASFKTRSVVTRTPGENLTIPSAGERASKFLGFNAEAAMIALSASAAAAAVDPYITKVPGPSGPVFNTYTDRPAFKAQSTSNIVASLVIDGVRGEFVFNPANLSAEVASDPLEGIYIAPDSDPTGAGGAWVRKVDEYTDVRWFGFGGSASANTAAANAALALSKRVSFPAGDFDVSGKISPTLPGTIIKGSGKTIIRQTANNTQLFDSDGVDSLVYMDLTIYGVGEPDTASTVNADGDTALAQAYGIHSRNADGFYVQRCKVYGFKNVGIRGAYVSNAFIEDNIVAGTYPDADIPNGITSRQQMGIEIFSKSLFEHGATAAEITDGTGTLHGNHTIRILNNSVGDTAIAILVLPGYTDVQTIGNSTFGWLTQHSTYAYVYDGFIVDNFHYMPASQQVGIKLSTNQMCMPKGIKIGKGTIGNTNSPAISFEIFDKTSPDPFDHERRTRMAFVDPLIDGVSFRNCNDIVISWGPTLGGKAINCDVDGVTLAVGRSLIDIRGSNPEIRGWKIRNVNRAILGAAPMAQGKLRIRDIEIDNFCYEAANIVPFSAAPAYAPYDVQPNKRYFEGMQVYDEATDFVYDIIVGGLAGATLPTGTGTTVSGEVTFQYHGVFADMKTKIHMENVEAFDTLGKTLSTKFISFNSTKFETSILDVIALPVMEEVNIQGLMRHWRGHNLRNTSFSGVSYDSQSRGRLGRDLVGTGIPVTGTYEKGDILTVNNPAAGGAFQYICVARGNPGTWRVLSSIAAS